MFQAPIEHMLYGSPNHVNLGLVGNQQNGDTFMDETRRLDQSETVKVERAVKQKYKKLGAPPPRPEILVALCLISSKNEP